MFWLKKISLKSYVTVIKNKQLEIKNESYKLWSEKNCALNKMALMHNCKML